jgi:hypothetical protein
MRQVCKQGNDLITQRVEDNESIVESIRSASSNIDEARSMQAVMLDLKTQQETLQIDYEKKIKGAHMDMLRASNVRSTPIDPKVNVKRGSDINEYEEDILYKAMIYQRRVKKSQLSMGLWDSLQEVAKNSCRCHQIEKLNSGVSCYSTLIWEYGQDFWKPCYGIR